MAFTYDRRQYDTVAVFGVYYYGFYEAETALSLKLFSKQKNIANRGGKQNTEELKKLVTLPLSQYSKLLGKDGYLEKHNQNHYHQDAILKSSDFLKTYYSPNKQVNNILNSERLRQVQENRYRGYRDSGKIIFHDTEDSKNLTDPTYSIVKNEGNFRELLKYRVVSGDTKFKNDLLNFNSKASYISPIIQEDLIKCCKEEILSFILDEVNTNQFYRKITYERFVGFINCHDTFNKNQTAIPNNDLSDTLIDDHLSKEPKLTGKVLGNIVVSELKEMSLNLKNCIGIGTYGCSVMTSVLRGAVQEVQKSCPNAIYSPYTNHALNLSISKSSKVQIVRNIMGILQETISFFHLSSKRNFILKNNLKSSKSSKTSLTSLCVTRWVERHTSIIDFETNMPEIIESLTHISQWTDQVSSSKANSLLLSLKIPEDVSESIDECHPVMFPTIRQVLVVLATLPVKNMAEKPNVPEKADRFGFDEYS
ncbi:uncharacterized protein LOC103310243 [Acyrthosiphon pisum]|uniref:Uncharacterized protein n=1 Tax=Acyrthosiphon pisum TaxID=7029 RepID=A0A8R2FAL6_ACYPI|nr:uncharacterized protein LOC103310243 [Acyrthosiphon pisum]|eukprot:XP_008186069.1 PREDICTED: uncharacterized protein LOC103310243 [Acyrthosiphon pisum]